MPASRKSSCLLFIAVFLASCAPAETSLRASRPGVASPLPDLIPFSSPEVEREIRSYLRDTRTLRLGIRNRRKYGRMFEQVFYEEGVPKSLIALGFVESTYEPERRSSAGAVGIWQFMRATAELYGLKVGFWEDQRKDPVLSTIAAARLLYDLRAEFGDWYLALAAYHRGSGGVRDIIREGKSRDFLSLVQSGAMPRGTARHVYRFLAAYFIMNNPAHYGATGYGTSNRPGN